MVTNTQSRFNAGPIDESNHSPRHRRMDPRHPPVSTRKERLAWSLYDFANSAFPTVIITAVYVIYFKKVVVGDAETGRSDNLWGMANSFAAAVVFLIAPILGAAADRSGRRRFFWITFAAICVFATGLLHLTGPGTVLLAMLLVIAAIIGFEGSCVFYNAFLPDLVPAERMGRLSGQAWASGYLGGLGCLLLILPLADHHITWVPLVVAAWFAVFSLPSFLLLKDRGGSSEQMADLRTALKGGLEQLVSTLRQIKRHRALVRFFIAYFFYNNAVATIVVFAVAFSSDSLSFTTKESILLITAMNVVASPGALVFGWLADRIGAKRTLAATLVMWLVVVAGAEAAAWPGLLSAEGKKSFFWAVAVLASLCIGAIQATSRSFVGQLAPRGQSGEFYGFMAFAGKGSAIVGPLAFGATSDLFDSQRAAVATIGFFFAIGLLFLTRVPGAPR